MTGSLIGYEPCGETITEAISRGALTITKPIFCHNGAKLTQLYKLERTQESHIILVMKNEDDVKLCTRIVRGIFEDLTEGSYQKLVDIPNITYTGLISPQDIVTQAINLKVLKVEVPSFDEELKRSLTQNQIFVFGNAPKRSKLSIVLEQAILQKRIA